MNIYKYLDYRLFLREYLGKYKKINPTLKYSSIAKHLGIHQAFLSKVFRLDGHLSNDQVFLLLKQLNLNSEEKDYFSKIYEYSRSGLVEKRKELLKEIETARTAQLSSEKKLQAEFQRPAADNRFGEYYLNPQLQLVHSFLTIPKYQKNFLLLLEHLQLNEHELRQKMETLVRLEIIEWNAEERRYKVLRDHLHLADDSKICAPWTTLTRVVAAERLLGLPPEKKYVVSVTFSSNPETKFKIKEVLLQALKKIETLVRESDAEKVYQLNVDLFPWEKE